MRKANKPQFVCLNQQVPTADVLSNTYACMYAQERFQHRKARAHTHTHYHRFTITTLCSVQPTFEKLISFFSLLALALAAACHECVDLCSTCKEQSNSRRSCWQWDIMAVKLTSRSRSSGSVCSPPHLEDSKWR